MTEQEARTKDSTIDDLFSLACKYADEATKAESRVAELEKQINIEQLKNKGSLANNLCPDHRDKQTFKPCLACTIDALEKQVDNLTTTKESLKMQIEDMACCGNCKNYGYTEKYCPHKEEMFAKEYYDCWQSDSLTRSERV